MTDTCHVILPRHGARGDRRLQPYKRNQHMPPRILVVNDTQEILDLFQELLTEEGYEVVLYSYGIEDLSEIERVKPDLIILDHIIGGEAVGWQMLQKLKMKRSTATIPVIVCTA